MSPKSERVATGETAKIRKLLSTYIQFLAVTGQLEDATRIFNPPPEDSSPNMAAIFDRSNPASPLAYGASHTALLLLDFQGFTVHLCGLNGLKALGKAKEMRDWAFAQNILVIHSVVDVKGKPPSTCKGAERITKMLEGIKDDRDAAEEPSDVAFSKADGEYIVLKPPGFVNALKSTGLMELLSEHGIKSLIICGLSTSGAVLRTGFPATDEGFVVSVIQDACSDRTEELHDTLVKDVLPSRVHVATAEEFIEQWRKNVKEHDVLGKVH